jgi:hypothetical protein
MTAPATVADALAELSVRLQIPCDIVAVHREGGSEKARSGAYASLRYGAFLLAYAPLEAFFDSISGYRQQSNHPLPLNPDKIRDVVAKACGVPDVTKGWAARTRVAPPSDGSTGNRSPWELLSGQRLRHYLADMKSLRDILGHGGDPSTTTNRSGVLHPLQHGRHSLRLMGVEGFIQAAQDLASETAIALCGPAVPLPDWPAPPSTGASDAGRLPRPY